MFSLMRGPAAFAIAGVLSTFASLPSPGDTQDVVAACAGQGPGMCDFTANGEGVHRIDLALPAAAAGRLREVVISGQACPLAHQETGTGSTDVHLACFAYLTGGITYKLNVPADAMVHVTRANPAHGEPITLIP